MAVAHDTATRFPAGTTSDTTTGDRSFTHTPTGTPKGVAIAICCTGTTRPVTGVTYGGMQMTEGVSAVDTTEAGSVWWYYLTEVTVPTGAQTVVLQGCIAAAKYATVVTVTAATDGTKINATNTLNTQATANPSISVTTTAASCGYSAFHSGNAAPVAAGTGNTLLFSMDYGQLMSQTQRRTSNAEAAGTITHATAAIAADDWCAAAIAIEEYTLPLPIPPVYFARERT